MNQPWQSFRELMLKELTVILDGEICRVSGPDAEASQDWNRHPTPSLA